MHLAGCPIPCPAFGQHPGQIALGSDGRTEILDLRWTGWGHPITSASGELRDYTGAPGSHTSQHSRVGVTLSRLEQCDGHRAYTNIRISSSEGHSGYRGCVPQAFGG